MTQDARTADFFGEGTFEPPQVGSWKRDWVKYPPVTNAEWARYRADMGFTPAPEPEQPPRTPAQRGMDAYFRQTSTEGAARDLVNSLPTFGRESVPVASVEEALTGYYAMDPDTRRLRDQWMSFPDAHKRVFPWERYLALNRPPAPAPGPTPDIAAPSNPNAPQPDPIKPGGAGYPGNGGPTPVPSNPNAPPAAPEPTPTHVRNAEVDAALGGLARYENAFWQLSQDNTGLSLAEAQLRRATEMANFQAAREAQRSQAAAFGAASSARNRGDRALLERQAIGQAGYIGNEAAIQAAENDRRMRSEMAVLRAAEEQGDRDFRFQALKEARDTGLNVAALEVDLSKVDVAAASDNMRIALGWAQLDQQKAKDMLDFTRDMAIIQQNYDRMSLDAQIETERLLMEKYRIDQATMVELKRIKEQYKFRWGDLLKTFVGGAGTGVGAAVTGDLVNSGGPAPAASGG